MSSSGSGRSTKSMSTENPPAFDRPAVLPPADRKREGEDFKFPLLGWRSLRCARSLTPGYVVDARWANPGRHSNVPPGYKWTEKTCERTGSWSMIRPRGRPRKKPKASGCSATSEIPAFSEPLFRGEAMKMLHAFAGIVILYSASLRNTHLCETDIPASELEGTR